MANIIEKMRNIRNSFFGKDVRESIASGIETVNEEVINTTGRQGTLESQFNGLVINAGSSNAEIVAGRTSNVTGLTNDTVGHRLDASDYIVNALQIGGVNLLTGTKDFIGDWATNGATRDKNTKYLGLISTKAVAPYSYYYQKYTFELGKTYNLSAWVRSNASGVGVGWFGTNMSGDNYISVGETNKWVRWSYTFVVDGNVHTAGSHKIALESGNASETNPLWVCGMTLVEDNKDIGWSPSPKDDRMEDIICYNVKEHLLYDNNHVDVSINDIVSKMVEGDKMLLPYGNYSFTSTLNLVNIPEGCKIIFDGRLNAVGNFSPAINLSGSGFKFDLNKISSNLTPSADYSNIINNGIILGDKGCSNSQIDINIIDGFLTGIFCYPNSGNGIQYNKINFNYIRNCKIGILLSTGSIGESWVNENTFIGGRLSGYYGIKTVKGTNQTDRFNNNKFYNVGFEDIKNDALTLSFAMNNSFVNNRMAEAIYGMYIIDDTTCMLNLFIISHLLPDNKINVNGKLTRIIAPIVDSVSGLWAYKGFTIDGNYVKQYEILTAKYQVFSNIDGIIGIRTKTIGIATDSSAITLTISKELEFEGNEILIKCNWYENTITIKNSDNSIAITPGTINAYGNWVMRRINSVWVVYQITQSKMLKQEHSVATELATLKYDFNNLLDNLIGTGYMKSS